MATAEGPGPSPASAGRSKSFVNALEDTRYEAPFDQMEAVCRTAGHPVPEVRVVEHLPWSKATMTAQASIYLTCAAGYADHIVGERSAISQMKQSNRRLRRPDNLYRNLHELISSGALDGA